MKEKIIDYHENKYSSSPVNISEEEIEIIIKSDCQCSNCGKSIFDMDDYPIIREGEVYCEDCEIERFFSTCPICSEHYENYTEIEEERIIISKETVESERLEVKPGFYKVLSHPIYFGNCITGFEGFFDNAIQLERECDINSMLYKLYPHNGEEQVNMDFCCNDCFEKYTGKTKIVNNYVDKKYGRELVKFEKKVISLGY